jgi:uncharacterized protein YjiK
MRKNKILKKLVYTAAVLMLINACEPKKNKAEQSSNTTATTSPATEHYNLDKPDQKYKLPKKLNEISGLSALDNRYIYAINDEKAQLYLYDTQAEEITQIQDFGSPGDYEGVEIVNQTAYILRSDGQLTAYDLSTQRSSLLDASQAIVQEYEGLCYDAASQSLLLAAKEMAGNKQIFAYHPPSGKLTLRYTIAKEMIEKNENGKDFKPSGIAVSPYTGHIYVLASVDKKLVVLDSTGQKVKQYNLDEAIFKQPEGISFSADGTLFIASEGGDGKGYLLKFSVNGLPTK